jgi:hypothetical protein
LGDVPLIGCVIYAAKSTEDRRGSIPDQLRECRSAIQHDLGRKAAGGARQVFVRPAAVTAAGNDP